jgi:hypothetical protein
MRFRNQIWWAIATLVLLPAGATAQQAAVPPDDAAPEPDASAQLDLSVLDPELAEALSTSSEGLVVEYRPDGSFHVDLQGRFRQAMFARVDAAGKVTVDHVIPLQAWSPASGAAAACREPENDSLAIIGGGDASR